MLCFRVNRYNEREGREGSRERENEREREKKRGRGSWRSRPIEPKVLGKETIVLQKYWNFAALVSL
jgi:hypothetical protein